VKIAQIAPIVERVPPKTYGGTERVVHALTEELVRRGHEVTLYASGDSLSSAKIESVYPRSLREAKLQDIYGANPWTLLNFGLAYDSAEDFDIIHDHMMPLSLPAANAAALSVPVVGTMHGAFNAANRKLFNSLRNPGIASISQAQIFSAPNINHVGTVYNGLPMEHYPFSNEHEGYLLYVGRISLEKGVHFAIEAAEELDLPLIIAAKLDPSDNAYYKTYIEPRLSQRVQWIGEVAEEERNQLMSKAKCFLHPVTWREPFGLTLIEAAATGCPVIAFNKGSIPEIIKTGSTGFVVEDIESMIDAVENIGSIDRKTCRDHALEHFSAKRMADEYEALYKKLVV
jgi:glycosyltransferase involved in cell wall biosynthesis